MMSVHERQVELLNLGRRIPEDHLLRRLQKVLRLEFVREETAQFYGRNGHESVDPVILMKLLILLFLDQVESERELMRLVPWRIENDDSI